MFRGQESEGFVEPHDCLFAMVVQTGLLETRAECGALADIEFGGLFGRAQLLHFCEEPE